MDTCLRRYDEKKLPVRVKRLAYIGCYFDASFRSGRMQLLYGTNNWMVS